MKFTELASLLAGDLKGNGDFTIEGIRDVDRVSSQGVQTGYIYFVESLVLVRKNPDLVKCQSIVTTKELADEFENCIVVPTEQARKALIKILEHFEYHVEYTKAQPGQPSIHPDADVADNATIMTGAVVMQGATVGSGAVLYPNVVVEPYAKIGRGSVVHANSVIGHHCEVGENCIIYQCSVIGADGFGYHDQPQEGRFKVPQIGNVVIGNYVEIGASSTVDRATIETTSIGDHTKFDNQVHIGHNCRVGAYVYIAGNSVLAGSVVLEDAVVIAGSSSVADHIKLAKGTVLYGMSGAGDDSEPGQHLYGVPAVAARLNHKINSAKEQLPELVKKVKLLEKKLEELE